MTDSTDTLHVSNHPAVLHKLGVLRDERTEPKKFREVVRELSWLLGYEALQDAKTSPLTIRTPLEEIEASELGERIGLVPILRAGLGMSSSIASTMPRPARRIGMRPIRSASSSPAMTSIGVGTSTWRIRASASAS